MSGPSSSSGTPSTSRQGGPSPDDIEKLLSREATAFQREMEVERILKAFKLKYVYFPSFLYATDVLTDQCSPYEILDLSDEATVEDVKKKYRQLSLCEHLPTTPPDLHSGRSVVLECCAGY